MRLHARHGWGYDARFWAPLAALLGPIAADCRGYHGPSRADPVAEDAPYLLIGHSLGVLRMTAEAGPACRGLVAINGFDRFVGGDGFPGVAPRVLARMAARAAVDPDGTAAAFRARLGDGAPHPGPATPRLRDDLALLGEVRPARLPDLPLLRLDGAADPLLTPAHRAACFAGRPAALVADGGHRLPVTHARWCADAITGFMAALA